MHALAEAKQAKCAPPPYYEHIRTDVMFKYQMQLMLFLLTLDREAVCVCLLSASRTLVWQVEMQSRNMLPRN